MDVSHTQPKLLDTEHAWGRKFQTKKNAFNGHMVEYIVDPKSAVLLLSITPFYAVEINSQVMFVVIDIC